ncbi:oligopeptide/dipeptide ABC transporter, ATPase subunit [Halovivax asiaticus JCM 14624]|uniref:Nickel import system ATP-binding protein NikD n=1 Tax=Halovivax asiaticus JCM 14624 TaxID=1227490 RepID=M0BEY2_9EURY|nr:ABC transporter ATP-binding protein [Halovivax asiaticus]ELZ08209.1 oligopeptide/dipeptide ABC transporter, ATPase subunit [Halovivax asiaticus JCM 14624]
MTEPLLSVENLHTHFETHDRTVHAVNGVSFDIEPGEVVGIVGESGSGKSVTARSIMRLEEPGKIVDGSIRYRGEALTEATDETIRRLRGQDMSMVFQDPMTTLNPVFTVSEQIVESLKVHDNPDHQPLREYLRIPFLHDRTDWAEKRDRVVELMSEVGIPNPEERLDAYPHEFSGGMRQRAMLAIALASEPDLLIADEPTTALDVTIQAQILQILSDLRASRDMSVMLITHDIGVVSEVCDRVIVMYGGQVMETGTTEQILTQPRHPYTQALLDCMPQQTERKEQLATIEGQVPNQLGDIEGCPFASRCAYADAACTSASMPVCDCGDGQEAACCALDRVPDPTREAVGVEGSR